MAQRPTQYQKLSLQLDAENKKLKAKLAATRKQMGGIGDAAKKMGGLIAGAFAVSAVVNFSKEAMQLAGVAEGVKAAFQRLNDPNLLANLRTATRGTVSDLDLMKAAVKANNFKVPLDKLASFFEFATKRSAQTGESVDYLVESIVNGIGRKSSLVLDNLGISAAELQEEMKKTGDFGQAAGNIIERELAKAGDVATTSAQRTASWGATMKNIQVLIGTELNKALNLLAPLVDKIMQGLIKGFNWAKASGRDLVNEFIGLYNESTAFRAVVEAIGFGFKTMYNIVKTNLMAVWELLKTTKDVILAVFDPRKSIGEAISQGWDNIKNLYVNLGHDTADNFNNAIENTLSKDKLPLLPTEDQQIELFNQASQLGANIGAQVKAGMNKGLSSDLEESLMMDELENRALKDQIDLNNELADVEKSRTEQSINDSKTLGDQLKEIRASSIKGLIAEGIAAAISKALAFIPPPFNLVAAGTAAAAASALFNKLIPSFATGIDYVPKTGLAMLHKGEKVTPAASNVGNNQLVAVVRGSDLHFVLDEYTRRRSSSY